MLLKVACKKASATRSVLIVSLRLQPLMRRVPRSMTAARQHQPCRVGMQVMPDTHIRLGAATGPAVRSRFGLTGQPWPLSGVFGRKRAFGEPFSPLCRMMRATRFRPQRKPSRRSDRATRG